MTIKQALALYPDIETDLLLANVLKKPKEFLFIHPEKTLTAAELKQYNTIARRRRQGEPIAYITGHKYFCGLEFKVNKNVLIPRPESEWLIEQGQKIIGEKLRNFNGVEILDMGTGSGCIAVSLYKRLPARQKRKVRIHAADISPRALTVARFNAKRHLAKIKFVHSDLFSAIPPKFDLIMANLPYVPIKDYDFLHAGLRFEPKIALTDGTDTGKIYKKFLDQAKDHLKPKADILLEIDPTLKPTITKLTQSRWQTKFFKDLQNLWRYAHLRSLD